MKRQKENKFLKKHGYTWHKESRYVDGAEAFMRQRPDLDGEFEDVWVLRDRNGKEIKDVYKLLIDLGYYGAKAKQEYYERIAEQEKERLAQIEREEKEKIENELKRKEYAEKIRQLTAGLEKSYVLAPMQCYWEGMYEYIEKFIDEVLVVPSTQGGWHTTGDRWLTGEIEGGRCYYRVYGNTAQLWAPSKIVEFLCRKYHEYRMQNEDEIMEYAREVLTDSLQDYIRADVAKVLLRIYSTEYFINLADFDRWDTKKGWEKEAKDYYSKQLAGEKDWGQARGEIKTAGGYQ